MTDAEIAALRALAEKATPGDWTVAPLTPCRIHTPDGAISISWSSTDGTQDQKAEDCAAYIAAANPAAVLAVLDRLARVEAERDRMREALRAIAYCQPDGQAGPDLKGCIAIARAALEPRA